MPNLLRPALMAIGVIAGFSGMSGAVAQTPSPEVTARQNFMKTNNQATQRALTPIARGEQPWNQQVATQQAEIMATGAPNIPNMFPAGTGPDKGVTNALPAIWANFPDFQAKAKTFADESAKLLQLARANDEAGFKAQFPKVGQACGACHQAYRKPLN